MSKRKKNQFGGGLAGLKSSVDKRFGEGTIMNVDDDAARGVEVFSTGSVSIDVALGVGGFPRGRVVEIYGPESSGKTTLTLQAIAEAQKTGAVAAFIDAEHAIDLSYADQLGVDTSALLISQPSCGEDALDIADMLARSGEVGLIVVDSVAALTPRAEIEGEMSDTQVGLQARMMGKALRKLTSAVSETGTTIIFINQLRQKIGVTFGSSETTTGGNALKFYASMRVDIRRIGSVKNGELIDLGVEHGVLEKSGAWYAWDDERLGQGREKCRAALLEDPERMARLRTAVLAAAGATTLVHGDPIEEGLALQAA